MADLIEMGQKAVAAKYVLQKSDAEIKNKVLRLAARLLVEQSKQILDANQIDVTNAQLAKMNSGLLDRLTLTGERIEAMAEGLNQIAELPDCIGEVMDYILRKEGFPSGLSVSFTNPDPTLPRMPSDYALKQVMQ